MPDELIVSVAELRGALDALLNEVERRFGPTIDLDADFYWDLEPSVIYDLTQVPPGEPAIGQLSDDVASIRSLLHQRQDTDVVLWHDLVHVVGVLRRVAALDLPATE